MLHKLLTIFSLSLIGFSLVWLLITYLPVMAIEVRYQSHQLVRTVFGINDVRGLFLPNFRTFNLAASSSHRDYGITIPTLGIDEPVVFNVNPTDERAYSEALRKGIAHASGTAFPDHLGLGYYFAHSSHPDVRSQFNAIFYLLGKLETGDEIYIWHDGQRYDYAVTEKRVVNPQDVSFLSETYQQETIVLQTCWPPGTSSKRLLVWGVRN